MFVQAAEKSITSQIESGGAIAKEAEQLIKHEVKKKVKQYSTKVCCTLGLLFGADFLVCEKGLKITIEDIPV